MKKYLPIFSLILLFLIIKATSLGIRLSDTNIYFFTGYKLLHGSVLYRDIFFTNFPFLPYLSAFYFLLTGGKLSLFFFTPVLEVSATAFLIYLIAWKETKSMVLSLTSSTLYLFSFIILSTSDHQTGVFFASLMATLSYYFYLHKKPMAGGIALAFALLTKIYFVPVFLTFLTIFLLEKKWRELVRFLLGAAAAGMIIMLPTIIFALPDFLKDVFLYSLTRSQGVEKSGIFWFFIMHDFVLFVLLLFNLFSINTRRFFGFLALFGIVFVFLYKDVYYLYLNFFIPFLALSFPAFYTYLQKNFSLQKAIVPTILVPFVLYSIIVYLSEYRSLQRLDNFSEIVAAVKKENPHVLYGVNDVTPVLSYASGTPMLHDIVDTNANIYRKGILNAKKLTADAIGQKALIIAHGVYYPQQGVEEAVVDEIFDRAQLKKSCKVVGSFPITMEGPENRLSLLKCR